MIGLFSLSFSGSFAPLIAANVAMKSSPPMISLFLVSGLIFLGVQAIAGTRLPPSRSVPLVPRNGV